MRVGAGVSRADLLLSGNGAQALVDSVASWSDARHGAGDCVLWAVENQRLRLLARRGQTELGAAEAVARRCMAASAPAREAGAAAWPLFAEQRLLGVMTVDGLPVGDEVLPPYADAARLLAQRLPAALELERLHRAVAQLAEA